MSRGISQKAFIAGVRTLAMTAALLVLASSCATSGDFKELAGTADATTIYLVRHAEKQDRSGDPGLTATGIARSSQLDNVLKTKTIDKLWSSDYARTQQTLAPLAHRLHIPVTLYDAHDSAALVATIMSGHSGQTHVIAGHSNTVPALVDLFQNWPATQPPDEPRPNLGHDEYDRLYVVVVVPGRPGMVEELRY